MSDGNYPKKFLSRGVSASRSGSRTERPCSRNARASRRPLVRCAISKGGASACHAARATPSGRGDCARRTICSLLPAIKRRRSTLVASLRALNRLVMTDALEATPMEIAESTSPAADGPGRPPSTSDQMEGCPTLSAIHDASGTSVDLAAEVHAQVAQLPAAASSGTGCFVGLDTHVVTIQPLTRAIVNEEQVCVCTGRLQIIIPESARGYVPATIAPDPKILHATCFLHADSVPVCRASRPCLLSASHDPHSCCTASRVRYHVVAAGLALGGHLIAWLRYRGAPDRA